MIKILLLEDDVNLGLLIKEGLSEANFYVVNVRTIHQAKAVSWSDFNLAIFDWNLPDGTGIDLLKYLNQQQIFLPVLFLTSRTDLEDTVRALELGAQDYIKKPFHMRELIARINLRLLLQSPNHERGAQQKHQTEHKDFVVDEKQKEVIYKGKAIFLSKMEYQLIKFFLDNPNEVYSREQILDYVWGPKNYGTNRTVDTHVAQLRKKFDADCIETVWGFGYRFLV